MGVNPIESRQRNYHIYVIVKSFQALPLKVHFTWRMGTQVPSLQVKSVMPERLSMQSVSVSFFCTLVSWQIPALIVHLDRPVGQ